MNKKIFLLPVLAGFMLVGCNGEDTKPCTHVDSNKDHLCDKCGKVMSKCLDGNKDHICDYCHEITTICADNNGDGKCDICGQMIPGAYVPEPEEFGGYRLVEQPEDGKEYIIGLTQQVRKEVMFVNGMRHFDKNPDGSVAAYYPYYLGCERYEYDHENDPTGAEIDAGKDAARFKIHYVDDTKFTIEIVEGTQKEDFYHGYLQVYGDYNGSPKTSFKFDTDLNSQYEINYGGGGIGEFAKCSNEFYMLKEFEGKQLNAIVTDFENMCNQGQTYGLQPVALATYNDYISISATTSNHFASNFMARFYEKIVEE